MKCIRMDGKIQRVKDDEAAKLVAGGWVRYVSKREWKAERQKVNA